MNFITGIYKLLICPFVFDHCLEHFNFDGNKISFAQSIGRVQKNQNSGCTSMLLMEHKDPQYERSSDFVNSKLPKRSFLEK
jgi:hypothetical protein